MTQEETISLIKRKYYYHRMVELFDSNNLCEHEYFLKYHNEHIAIETEIMGEILVLECEDNSYPDKLKEEAIKEADKDFSVLMK